MLAWPDGLSDSVAVNGWRLSTRPLANGSCASWVGQSGACGCSHRNRPLSRTVRARAQLSNGSWPSCGRHWRGGPTLVMGCDASSPGIEPHATPLSGCRDGREEGGGIARGGGGGAGRGREGSEARREGVRHRPEEPTSAFCVVRQVSGRGVVPRWGLRSRSGAGA